MKRSLTDARNAGIIPYSAFLCASGCFASLAMPTGLLKISTLCSGRIPSRKCRKNWVGRSEGAEVDFFIGQKAILKAGWPARTKSGFPSRSRGGCDPDLYHADRIRYSAPPIWCWLPNILWWIRLTTDEHREQVEAYRQRVAETSEEDRIAGRGEKSGVFTGGYAINPVTGETNSNLDCRLRSDQLWNRRHHGRAGSRPARSRICAQHSIFRCAPW